MPGVFKPSSKRATWCVFASLVEIAAGFSTNRLLNNLLPRVYLDKTGLWSVKITFLLTSDAVKQWWPLTNGFVCSTISPETSGWDCLTCAQTLKEFVTFFTFPGPTFFLFHCMLCDLVTLLFPGQLLLQSLKEHDFYAEFSNWIVLFICAQERSLDFSIDLGTGKEGEKLLAELHPPANITDYVKVDFLFLLLLNQLESRGIEIAALYYRILKILFY